MHDYLKSGRQAIRLLYFLIIGLSITKAIQGIFVPGIPFHQIPVEHWILFVVFFSFVSRFFLGAYRVLSYDIEIEVRRGKVVLDILILLLQSLIFYVFSLTYTSATSAQWAIIFICGTGLLWLLLLQAFEVTEPTFRWWLLNNFIVTIVVGANLVFWNSTVLLLALSLVAAAFDFCANSDFYFSLNRSPGLRIFVAGPYGDQESAEVKAENVERAKSIGKELALKGHYPFVPHTMLHGWELDDRFTVDNFKDIDFAWMEFCDALFLIAESPGANVEKEMATQKGLQIFTQLEHVPTVDQQDSRKSRLGRG